MKEEAPIPRLREDLEIIPTLYQGEKAFVVRDFLGLIRDPVIIQGDALQVMSLIDGKRTLRDIQVELVRIKNGVLVDKDSLQRLIKELESAFLLLNRQYQDERERILRAYAGLRVRSASHAAVAYPEAADKLRLYLDSILANSGPLDPKKGEKVCALVAPHIDLETGKRVYAKAYASIRNLRPKRILLLGTGHNLDDDLFCLTEKDYETPLGRAKTDQKAVRELRRAGGKAVSAYDISHRREHSLEFQLLFLQHLFGDSFTLLPVLCGPFGHYLTKVSRPSEIPEAAGFLAFLSAWWKAERGDTLVVVGVDFSHIGPKFGHRERATALLLEARQHDQALIAALTAGDVSAFWAESRRVQDKYNVCGFSALASLLEFAPRAKGRLLDYEFWREEPTQSAVSYAAIVLTAG